jgi:hypothetical protein
LRLTPAAVGEFGRASYRLPVTARDGFACTFRLLIDTDYRYPRQFSFSGVDAAEAAAPLPRRADNADEAPPQNMADHRWFAVDYRLQPVVGDRAAWSEICRRDGAPWWEAAHAGAPGEFRIQLMGGSLVIADLAVQPAAADQPAPTTF